LLKVAFLTDAHRVAGSEIWLLETLPRLPKHGLSPTLFLPQRPTLANLAHELEARGVEVRMYTRSRDLPEATSSFQLRVLQALQAQSYYNILPKLARPRFAVVHDQPDYHYPLGLRFVYWQAYYWSKKIGLKAADKVITVSRWAAAFLMGIGIPALGIPNGVDPERFRPPAPGEREELRKRYGFEGFTVLIPGRFALEKNQIAALLAARLAREFTFVFVGDLDSLLGFALPKLGQGLNNVRFLGRRADMPELYRAADVMLLPTLGENQSLATLEAMASGLPVVTTPIPAQAELIQDGEMGRLVPPRPSSLAQALREAKPEMGLRGRVFVERTHTLDQSARRLANILQNIQEEGCE